ncbi:MAG: LacI family transcriptional regulator [Propionibacteriaceae bacterium]|jgi:LacI family transcriptional regulator|nr:LacI family transcriptional regulator [Propionibacteriaceae bacterium]
MVTIYDVAKRAGVSPATVSRVYGGQTPVTPDRVQAVRAAAEELGFVPNRNARRLRTNSSEIIAMMVPDVSNSFFTHMTRAVEDVARAAGFSVMLCNTDEDPEREQEYLRVATSEQVAGIIIAPNANSELDWAVERGVPMVCVDRHAPHHEIDAVVVDNITAATAATHLLFEAGYTRLGCITGPETVETSTARLEGWMKAVRDHTGTDPDPELVLRARYVDDRDGERAAQQLLSLDNPPDAIFAGNNRLATGTLRALYRLDTMPPKVGLVAFGGPPNSLFAWPGVIVTYLPDSLIGTTAAAMLIERINGLESDARTVTLPIAMEDPGTDVS